MTASVPGGLDDLEQRDVVKHLVTVVPGIEHTLTWVVVHHGDVRVLVVEWDVRVLVGGRVGVVGEVDLGTGEMRVGDVERTADHEGLTSTALGKARVPRLQDLQALRLQAADHDVARVGDGGVHDPQSALVSHQVDIGRAAP